MFHLPYLPSKQAFWGAVNGEHMTGDPVHWPVGLWFLPLTVCLNLGAVDWGEGLEYLEGQVSGFLFSDNMAQS